MKMNNDIAYFCGLWIAEGSFEESIGRISITCGDNDVGEFLESGAVFGVPFKKSRKDQWRANSHELLEIMRFLNMPLVKAPSKWLPEWVWSGTREWAIEVLSGILDGDGYVLLNGRRAGFTTASERLARDIQLLLTNLGITSSLTSVESKPTAIVKVPSMQWRVTVEGKYLSLLASTLRPRIARKASALAAVSKVKKTRRGVPHTLSHLASIKSVFSGVKMPRLAAALQTARKGGDITEDTISGVLDECVFAEPTVGYQALKKLIAEGYVWDEVLSVTDGKAHTYDFTIPDTHSFWSNGFISHNTPKAYNFLYQLWATGQSEKAKAWESWQFPTITSPFIPASEIEAAREDMDAKSFKQEFEASFEVMSGRVYHSFDRNLHVKELEFNPHLPIWIGQDFNIDPMSSVILQRQPDGSLWAIDEICLPSSNTEELCDELEKRYWRYTEQITIYPDPAGAYRGHQRGESDLDIFRERGFKRQKFRKKHPPVADRVNAVNRMLRSASGTVRLLVDPRCKKLIEALEQTLYVPKSREVDKRAGVEHAADALGYCIEFEFPSRKFEVLGASI